MAITSSCSAGQTTSPSWRTLLDCSCTSSEVLAGRDYWYLAHQLITSEFPEVAVELWCEVSSLPRRWGWTDTLYPRGICWDGAALVWIRTWAVCVKTGIPDGVVAAEVHGKMVRTSFPNGLFWPWDIAFPLEHVERTIVVGGRFGNEPMRMVFPPFWPFLFEPVDNQLIDLLSALHCNISIDN